MGVFITTAAIMFSIWAAIEESWWPMVGMVPVIVLAMAHSKGKKLQFDQAKALIETHAKELAIRKRQLVVTRNYGLVDRSAWDKEIGFFVSNVVAPAIKIAPLDWESRERLYPLVDAAADGVPADSRFRADLTPIEYEAFVAETLRECGWDARTTKASGDQGVDVLAMRGGISVVIQCKLYSSAVGNAAVQEAIAGQQFEKADYAAVVSNATYTKAARQLAAAADVLLLHHEELPLLADRLVLGTLPATAAPHRFAGLEG